MLVKKKKKKDNENDKHASLSFCFLIEYHMLGEKGKKNIKTMKISLKSVFIYAKWDADTQNNSRENCITKIQYKKLEPNS